MEAKQPFSDQDWQATPEPVRQYIMELEQTIAMLVNKVKQLEKRTEKLENKTNQNSQNSSKPPSSDSPFKKPEKKRKKSKRKKGAQKGHKGHKQQLLEPTQQQEILPEKCECGCSTIIADSLQPYYTQQVIELPEIKMDVLHLILNKGKCQNCGKIVKAKVPKDHQTGYGPRLSALIAEMSGIQGNSRETVRTFCKSVLNFSISIGAIQRVVDRASAALKPIYDKIGELARENEAFLELIQDWSGILVSDNYGTYKKWVHLRQTCLAHLIRKAKALSEAKDTVSQHFGKKILKELQLLCHWAKAPPDEDQWYEFYQRFIALIFDHHQQKDESGTLARSLIRQIDSLWVFLEVSGVEPTNNRAERTLRFGVLWRKRSKGTQSEKGNRWVERVLSFKQTCQMRSLPSFPLLLGAIDSFFKEQKPNLDWL